MCVVFPDHPPKIRHGAAERRLTHDVLPTAVVSLWTHGRRQAKRDGSAGRLKDTLVSPSHRKR